MNYENLYKNALERARVWKEKSGMPKNKQGILDDIFPQLKESEDEKIRKDIIKMVTNTCKGEWFIDSSKEECLSWLEKQGEQKPADKVEPFDKYEGLTDFERALADICIGWIGEELGWKQYIKDNADVLLKIAVEKFNSVQDVPFEQKPAWSEEDEVKINRIVACLENLNVADNDILLKDVDWLKSIKTRYTWKPSDEQMKALLSEVEAWTKGCPKQVILESLYNDLKKLKG